MTRKNITSCFQCKQRKKKCTHQSNACQHRRKMQIMQNRREFLKTACGEVTEICLPLVAENQIGLPSAVCSLQKVACRHSLHIIKPLYPSVWLSPLSPSLGNWQKSTRLQVVACAGREVTSFPPRLWVTGEPFSLFKAPILSCPPPVHPLLWSKPLPGLSAPSRTANWAALGHKEQQGDNYSLLFKTKIKCLSAQVGLCYVTLCPRLIITPLVM